MADVELPPLPEHFAHQSERVQQHVRDYARANLTQLQAENEALRAENERLRRQVEILGRLKKAHSADMANSIESVLRSTARAERLAEALRNIRRAALDGCSAMDCARDAYDALALEDRNG